VLLCIPNTVDNPDYEVIISLLIFVTLGLLVISSFSVTVEVACIMLLSLLLQLHFRDVTLTAARITDMLSRMTHAGSHFMQRIWHSQDLALAPDEKGQKARKGQIVLDHTYSTVSSRPRGRCVQSLVQIGSEM